MKSLSQAKVSTISFLIALIVSIVVFGFIAYSAISGIMAPDDPEKVETSDTENTETPGDELVVLDPEEIESINGESFTVLLAGYDLQEIGFDAMAVIDVDKEAQKVTIYPINTDTKVYVGHGDSNSLNIRAGDLIKYKDMQYVLDKINATTGLKIEYYITLTAQGFIKAFDAFNKNGDYSYKVTKDMEHLYYEQPEVIPSEGEVVGEETVLPDAPAGLPEASVGESELPVEEVTDLTAYNISFKKGDIITSGIDVYNMLRYKGDSVSERTSRQTAFIKEVIAKIIPSRFKEGNLSAVVDTVKALVALSESIRTNINTETFIVETFDLISAIPNFSVGTVTKYTSGIANFK